MPSVCNMANIVVWLCSIDPIARHSMLCRMAFKAIWLCRKDSMACVIVYPI